MPKTISIILALLACGTSICHAEVTPRAGKVIPIFNNLSAGHGIGISICCNPRERLLNFPRPGETFSNPNQSLDQVIYTTPATKFSFQKLTGDINNRRDEVFDYTCEPEDVGGCSVQPLTKAFTDISTLGVRVLCDGSSPMNKTGLPQSEIQLSVSQGSLRFEGVNGEYSCDRNKALASEPKQKKGKHSQ
jgi:hypothetical protein